MPELTAADRASLGARYDEEIAFVDQELERLAGLQASPSDPAVVLSEEVEEELRALGYLD